MYWSEFLFFFFSSFIEVSLTKKVVFKVYSVLVFSKRVKRKHLQISGALCLPGFHFSGSWTYKFLSLYLLSTLFSQFSGLTLSCLTCPFVLHSPKGDSWQKARTIICFSVWVESWIAACLKVAISYSLSIFLIVYSGGGYNWSQLFPHGKTRVCTFSFDCIEFKVSLKFLSGGPLSSWC